jgi:hypothetical protein
MRSISLILLSLLLLISCSKSDSNSFLNSSYVPNIAFDTGDLINTTFTQYNELRFAGNYVTLDSPYGLNGFVLFYAGGDNYSAFELTDPNHILTACSRLTVEGVIASCLCDDGNSYDILTGQGQENTTGQFTLKRYFVEVNGNIIRVYNN